MEKVADLVIERSLEKAEEAEVTFSQGWEKEVSFENNQLKILQAEYATKCGLRVVCEGKIGVAVADDLKKVDGLVERAITTSRFGPEKTFDFPVTGECSTVKTSHPGIDQIDLESYLETGRRMIDDVTNFDAEVLCNLSFSAAYGLKEFFNSNGLRLSREGTLFEFSGWWDRVRDKDMLAVGEFVSRRDPRIDFWSYNERAKTKISQAGKTAGVKTGYLPVIFSPRAFQSLLAYVARALNGEKVLDGTSRLEGQLGERFFDPRFSLKDNGLLDWKAGSLKFDDDGIPVRPLSLVKEGVVKNFYYDLQTASRSGEESTGHAARRLSQALSSPRVHNLIVEPGERGYSDLLGEIEEGILAEQFMGELAGNLRNGDFSLSLHLGYKIEKGEVVGRVKDTMIAGNVFDLLSKGLHSLSLEREWVDGTFYSPYVILEPVSVVSSG